MNNEINVLDELSKGSCMGMDAIYFIKDKVTNDKLKDFLNKQYNEYKTIKNKIDEIYPQYSTSHPHETGELSKAMTWYGIEINTLIDNSDSKIAELLLKGTNMGIIEGRKLLNHKNTNKEINKLVEEYVQMQEKAVETLKKFL
jgi:hypothetical protein